uniref:Uncharacterized protein n=1 Tax=Caenorhabditis japonica TaxID=281687 RepID=A0A8R1HGE2_CAEJA
MNEDGPLFIVVYSSELSQTNRSENISYLRRYANFRYDSLQTCDTQRKLKGTSTNRLPTNLPWDNGFQNFKQQNKNNMNKSVKRTANFSSHENFTKIDNCLEGVSCAEQGTRLVGAKFKIDPEYNNGKRATTPPRSAKISKGFVTSRVQFFESVNNTNCARTPITLTEKKYRVGGNSIDENWTSESESDYESTSMAGNFVSSSEVDKVDVASLQSNTKSDTFSDNLHKPVLHISQFPNQSNELIKPKEKGASQVGNFHGNLKSEFFQDEEKQKPLLMDSAGIQLDHALAECFGHKLLVHQNANCTLPAPSPVKNDYYNVSPHRSPKNQKKTVWYSDNLVNNKKTFDEVVNTGGSGFRILSIHDRNKNTVIFPPYIPPETK